MRITVEAIEKVAKETLRWPDKRQWESHDEDQRFRSFFGAPPFIVVDVWNRIEETIDAPGAHPRHLLWALVFLKVYQTEDVHCCIVGWPCKETYRKWSWYFIEKMSQLAPSVIDLERRFDGIDATCTTNAFMSIDCTDCPINEPWPFNKKWFSKKFNGPGLRYEVGVCIKTGAIVWINGPFIASKDEGKIFKETLSGLLCDDEAVEVDRGPKGDVKLKHPQAGFDSKEREEKSKVRGRHENVNGRLKMFHVLSDHFHHMQPNSEAMMMKHKWCFQAVAVITQLKFDGGEQLYDVDYNVNYF